MVLVLVEISTSVCSLRCRRPSVSGSVAIESGFVEIEKLESVFVIDRLVSIGDAWFGHVLVFGLHSCSRTQRCRPIRARSRSRVQARSRYRVQNFRLVDVARSKCRLWEGRSLRWPDLGMSSLGRPIMAWSKSRLGEGRSLRWPDLGAREVTYSWSSLSSSWSQPKSFSICISLL